MGSNGENSTTLAAITANLPLLSNRAPARQHLRQEPCAGNPLAGNCAGGCRVTGIPTATTWTPVGPDVTFSGTVINTSGAETGITVNGIPATITGNHFIANHVSLAEGANSIEVKATDANGVTTSTTRSVTASPGNYIRISSNIESGTAPLNLSFQLEGSFSIDNPVIRATGPVPPQVTAGSSSTEFTTNLTVEGAYTFTANAVGPDGQRYSDSVRVTVINRIQLENLLKRKWSKMKERITAIDVNGTLGFIASRPHAKYQEIFTALGTQLPLLNDYLKDIEMVYSSDGNAKCRLYRNKLIMGQVHNIEYVIYFVQENGIWKLYQF